MEFGDDVGTQISRSIVYRMDWQRLTLPAEVAEANKLSAAGTCASWPADQPTTQISKLSLASTTMSSVCYHERHALTDAVLVQRPRRRRERRERLSVTEKLDDIELMNVTSLTADDVTRSVE
jgi:hypothetical protein